MAWGTSPSPPAAAPAAPTPMTANNVIFLILFGMFLMATLLPILMATLFRLVILVSAVIVIAVATNPSDHSFALWTSQQNEPGDLVPDVSVGVSKWFSAVYQTAKALVCNEPLTWRFHNALVFSVVHVPCRERYAFGVFGTWRWADEAGDFIKALCRAPWVMKISRGGFMSSIENYTVKGSEIIGDSSFDGVLRRRKATASTGSVTSYNEVKTESHRQIRAKAMQFKVRKDWKNAAVFFREAAKVAGALLTRANYELESAWCTLEEAETYPNEQSDLFQRIRSVCDELATAGYFDEAARGLSELALRLKRKFPVDCKKIEQAMEVAELYLQAKNVAEAGGSAHTAAENGLSAARLYTDAGLWSLAGTCFEAVGDIRRGHEQNELANEAYGNAVLCRFGQLDMAGAESMLNRFTEHMGDTHRSTDMDNFLFSILEACSKWSPQVLERAAKRYDSLHRLAPWQRTCLAKLQDKMNSADLR
ncbi:unnamed protein product [Peronospora farinosa]|uniref:Uncharacterized protein n=1 Tax=Peronospora farinosa TaxID=134698 RepID=A0AAV0UQD9_9STRA|nr:unnamed protein product [Peronospora farinosa]CAI5736899.1 unnamed protein product [Peronospora farinosa]